jgi:hypothetical protein
LRTVQAKAGHSVLKHHPHTVNACEWDATFMCACSCARECNFGIKRSAFIDEDEARVKKFDEKQRLIGFGGSP